MAGSIADIPPMVIGGSIISVVSLILHIVGFATTYWFRDNNDSNTFNHFGLWKSCRVFGGNQKCDDIKDPFARLKATEALECLALAAFLSAVVCAILKMFVLKNQRMLFVVTGLLNLLAGGFALIGVIVFATIKLHGHFHYSFGLCIVGGIGGVFSGIVFILAWRWVKDYEGL
ncbi:uncharacterized protein LOC127723045 [Mytilus californianus]|uniref:uncharacterized protein LOC127723045 n=1 Tax=Mytilus californianus TaxID=6549 RepID=UPI0022471E51|nr:uncharacterized protein LOC127723045 [Mytilus californianus]